MLPFTPEQFLGVFVNYNNAIWPIQIAAYVLGAISIASLLRRTRAADRVIAGILAAMWLWTGIAFHGVFSQRSTGQRTSSARCSLSKALICYIRACIMTVSVLALEADRPFGSARRS